MNKYKYLVVGTNLHEYEFNSECVSSSVESACELYSDKLYSIQIVSRGEQVSLATPDVILYINVKNPTQAVKSLNKDLEVALKATEWIKKFKYEVMYQLGRLKTYSSDGKVNLVDLDDAMDTVRGQKFEYLSKLARREELDYEIARDMEDIDEVDYSKVTHKGGLRP